MHYRVVRTSYCSYCIEGGYDEDSCEECGADWRFDLPMGETTHVEFESDDLDKAFEAFRNATPLGKPAIYSSYDLQEHRTDSETGLDVWKTLVTSGGDRAGYSEKEARAQSGGHWKSGRMAMMRLFQNVYVSVYVTGTGAKLRKKFGVEPHQVLRKPNRRRRKSKDEYAPRVKSIRHRTRPSRKPDSDDDFVL